MGLPNVIGAADVQHAVSLKLLAATAAAVDPEAQAGVGGAVQVRVIDLQAVIIGRGDGDADGIAGRVDGRGVRVAVRRPAPILEAVVQLVGIDREIALRAGGSEDEKSGEQPE